MSKRSFRIALAAVTSSLVVVGIIMTVLVVKACHYPQAQHDGTGKTITVEIKRGMSIGQIAHTLSDKDVIDKPTWFRLYAMWRGATGNGPDSVKSGTYQLRDDMTPEQVLDKLIAGPPKEVTADVTIPEGLNMLEVFALIEKSGVAKAAELEALARDPSFLQSHGITGDSVDGYLFPSTYNFRVPEKPQAVLERLIDTHRKVWREISDEHAKSLHRLQDRLKWSDRDVVILASIVQKEAGVKEDERRIAQVFVNRMESDDFKPHHRLQTDPTIRYGCEVPLVKSAACKAWKVTDRLHDEQLKDVDNPYNTYTHEGLPPGPISNPGRDAMAAAADPDGSDYFYFVLKPGSKSSAFARTYDEHEQNVQRYLHGS